jgi:hypothetical protein
VNGQFTQAGQFLFYKIQAPAGADLSLSLTGPTGAVNELYLKFGDLPSRQSFDERGIRPNQAAQSVSVSGTVAGTYYLMVYAANLTSAETFTLNASLTGFSIAGVTPNHGSNTGRTTVSVTGAQFNANSQVRLIDSAGAALTPLQTVFIDSGLISATCDLAGHPTGLADIQVINPGNVTQTALDVFNVINGPAGRLVTTLSVPSRVRLGRDFSIIIEYTNTGETDLVAPTLRLVDSSQPLAW